MIVLDIIGNRLLRGPAAAIPPEILATGAYQLSDWLDEVRTPVELRLELSSGLGAAALFVPPPPQVARQALRPGDISAGIPLATICVCASAATAHEVWHRHTRAASERIHPSIAMPSTIPWASFQGHFPYERGDSGTREGTAWLAVGIAQAIAAHLLIQP